MVHEVIDHHQAHQQRARFRREHAYLLERSDGNWRILSYISRTDQNAEMAKEGLL